CDPADVALIGCSAQCLLTEGESCDEDWKCETGVCDTLGDFTCEPASQCGNGKLEGDEVCDDGNTLDEDGCSSGCLREVGESCLSDAECASSVCEVGACQLGGVCGNFRKEGAEQCDFGLMGTVLCTSNCELVLDKQCADDLDCAGGRCNQLDGVCAFPRCGDAVRDDGEACDDGNTKADDGCSSDCLREDGESCFHAGECVSKYCSSEQICTQPAVLQEARLWDSPEEAAGVITESSDETGSAETEGTDGNSLPEGGPSCSVREQDLGRVPTRSRLSFLSLVLLWFVWRRRRVKTLT
ncbi:MAG: DUF4215 domain-containing protein, partial [Polyangiaceae bacterium]|nr:DUF4215 domain-containing protein [Polyangiaceae bacterium]